MVWSTLSPSLEGHCRARALPVFGPAVLPWCSCRCGTWGLHAADRYWLEGSSSRPGNFPNFPSGCKHVGVMLLAYSVLLSYPSLHRCHAAAIVYSVDSKESFEKARYWVDQLQKNASGSIGERSRA